MMDEILLALTPVADTFDTLSIPFFIGGSVAAASYDVKRATNDIDLIADVREEHAQPLDTRLSADYYADAQMIRDAVRRKASFNFIHFGTGLKVDVFLLKNTPYMQMQMQRRMPGVLVPGGRAFPFASPEDTILAKLDWYRIGGEISDRQWNDITLLLDAKRGALDLAYMRQWAQQLGLTALLDRAFTATSM